MPRATETQATAKPSKPRKPRARKASVNGSIRLTGDRLVVRTPESGERKTSGGLLIPATAMPAPKRLSWGDVTLVGPVGAAHPGDGLLVVVEEGIHEPPRGHQVGVHTPRYDSRDVTLQRPGAAQVFGKGHRFLISWRRR